MKKLLLAAALLFSLASFATNRVDEELERKFRESFPAASAIKWFDNANGYEVCFTLNDVQCRINYSADGTMLQMRRNYGKETLPLFITGAVQQRYPGKKIFGVTELTTEGGLTYHIVLEDDRKWYFVVADGGGNLSMNKKMRKG